MEYQRSFCESSMVHDVADRDSRHFIGVLANFVCWSYFVALGTATCLDGAANTGYPLLRNYERDLPDGCHANHGSECDLATKHRTSMGVLDQCRRDA